MMSPPANQASRNSNQTTRPAVGKFSRFREDPQALSQMLNEAGFRINMMVETTPPFNGTCMVSLQNTRDVKAFLNFIPKHYTKVSGAWQARRAQRGQFSEDRPSYNRRAHSADSTADMDHSNSPLVPNYRGGNNNAQHTPLRN